MLPRHLSLAVLALLAACATPSQRITKKLMEYGLPPVQARCMGDGLQARLSTAQLQRVGEVGRVNKDRIGRMTISDIAGALDKPGDEALVGEVLRTGLRCAF